MKQLISLLAVISCLLTAAPAAHAIENRHFSLTMDLIGPVDVVAPAADPTSFVIYISDTDGVTASRRAEADLLVGRGAAVALVDINEFIKRQATSDDVECHYAFGDLEDLAHAVQRELRAPAWLWPVILGVGQGGTAAYLTIAQAPANTAAGAVSIGFGATFKSKLPFCPGAPDNGKGSDGFNYAPMTDIPGRWTLVSSTAPDETEARFLAASQGTKSVVTAGGAQPLFASALTAVLEIASLPKPALSSIPTVELPATDGPARAIFVLMSGDGGWRDIDKQIGEFLSQHGVGVVGIDSLRYFWKKKTPQQIAADLNQVIDHYTKQWGNVPVGLGGFSFGADAVPLAWKHLSPASQKTIGNIVLLGLEPTAALEVTVSGWLGISDAREIDVKPYLSALPREKTMCFYGTAEKSDEDTACVFKELDGVRRFERPGGHHFDGDYESVARIILEALTSVSQRKEDALPTR